MKWNKRGVVPPLGRESIAAGNTDGGFSIPLLHKHQSGRISAGRALLNDGKVAWWYPGEIGDNIHSPEMKDEKDPIVEWAVCPTATQIKELIEVAEMARDFVRHKFEVPFNEDTMAKAAEDALHE